MAASIHRVIVIADLPPPAQGISIVTAWVADFLQQNGIKASIIDTTAKRRRFYVLRRISKFVKAYMIITRISTPSTLYIPLSHGTSLLLQTLIVKKAKSKKFRIIVHHHTFLPINNPKLLINKICHSLLKKNVEHIFLSNYMQEKYIKIWNPEGKCWVVTNHRVATNRLKDINLEKRITGAEVCFSGRLSAEKGFWEAIATTEQLLLRFPDMRANFLGVAEGSDVENEIIRVKEIFRERFNHMSAYEVRKLAQVLSQTTFYLFPSKYINEASPLVVLEAQAAGNVCFTSDIGSLTTDVIAPGFASSILNWHERVIKKIEELKLNPENLHEEYDQIKKQTKLLSSISETQLKAVFSNEKN